ncbi:MAG: PLP-dependent transferase [Myxococcota bacterium]
MITNRPSDSQHRLSTVAARAAVAEEAAHGAVMPPLHLSSNFRFKSFGVPDRYDYTRSGNPTRTELEQALARLEGGTRAVATPSGMAAVTLLLSRLRPGARLVAPFDGYGGTHRLMSTLAERAQIELLFLDYGAQEAEARLRAFRPDLVWLETPSNPLLRITDLRRCISWARAVGAEVAVDNTFLTPFGQQPFRFGADFVVHSTTKAINGHSDVVAGAVVARTEAQGEDIAWWANCLGLCQAPFDAYMTLRGLRTLPMRLRQMEASALHLAARLRAAQGVAAVHFPGLRDHPGHAIALEQQSSFGFMLAFELSEGRAAAQAFVESLCLFTLAESLGGVESLVCHPRTMTHAAMDEAARLKAGIGEGLLRLAVGCEGLEDLVEDLNRGLAAVR